MTDLELRNILWRLLYSLRPPGKRRLSTLLTSGRRSATLRDSIQDVFEEYVRRLADTALATPARWEDRMGRAVRNQLVAQHSFAIRRQPLPTEMLEIARGPLAEQEKFLARFRRDLPNMTEPQIARRSAMYSGAGRAQWFRARELSEGEGILVYYVAVDDKVTCLPCFSAEENGPYKPGEGPFPGEVCLGRGSCRCRRESRAT
jgi:hypothetical protein